MKIYWMILAGVILFLSVGVVSAIGTFPPVDPNMVLYWHTNNNSAIGENATFIVDSSPSSNNGSVKNATLVCGQSSDCPQFNATGGFLGDGAYELNGVANYLQEIRASSNTNISGNVSLSFWFKAYNLNGTKQALVGRSATTTRFGYGCFIETTNEIKCHINNASSTLGTMASGGNGLLQNTWYFVTETYDTSGSARMYINAVPNSSVITVTGDISPTLSGLTIGRWGQNSSNYFNGSIDEVIVWNRTLTSQEVWGVYRGYVGCLIPIDGSTLLGDTTLCSGTYNLNGSASGALILNSNLTLNLNGSTLVGNFSSNATLDLRGILLNGNNVTIKNGFVTNYYRGIYLNSDSDIKIINITGIANYMTFAITGNSLWTSVINSSSIGDRYSGVYISASLNTYANITGSFFVNASRFGIEQVAGGYNYIFNNTFMVNNTNGGISDNVNNTLISDNVFINDGDKFSEGIRLVGSRNTWIQNNILSYSQYNIFSLGGSQGGGWKYNITIFNNTFKNGDEGTTIIDTIGLNFINNTIINMTLNYDAYNVGIKIANSSNINIIGNNFSQIATVGILSQGNYNVTISNNYFDFISLSDRNKYLANDGFEPRCAIQSTKRYKGFLAFFGNENLTLFNNTFYGSVPCYVQLENQSLFVSDISNYWYTSFRPNLTFTGLYEFYVPQYYNNLSRYSSGVFYNLRIGDGSLGSSFHIEYNSSKSVLSLKDINQTTSKTIEILNQSSSLVYYSNLSVACQDTPNCRISINATITSNNFSYVLNNYNLTEGVNRPFNPVWFSSSTSTTRRIMSNLTDSINATLVLDSSSINCNELNRLGFNDLFYYDEQATDQCNNLISEGYIMQLNSGSNTIVWTYGSISQGVCTTLLNLNTLTASQLTLILMLFIFGIIFSIVGGIYLMTTKDINPLIFIPVFIAILIAAILVAVSATITTGFCGL